MKTTKYFEVSYTKAIGGTSTLNAKGRNENEAIANAKDNCFTGSDFKIIREIAPTRDTVRGGGSQRQRI